MRFHRGQGQLVAEAKICSELPAYLEIIRHKTRHVLRAPAESFWQRNECIRGRA